MVEMCRNIDRMIFPQHIYQVRRNAHGKHGRCPGAQTDDFHVGNRPECFKNRLYFVVIHYQGIAAGYYYIPYFRMIGDIVYCFLENREIELNIRMPYKPPPSAMSAIH